MVVVVAISCFCVRSILLCHIKDGWVVLVVLMLVAFAVIDSWPVIVFLGGGLDGVRERCCLSSARKLLARDRSPSRCSRSKTCTVCDVPKTLNVLLGEIE